MRLIVSVDVSMEEVNILEKQKPVVAIKLLSATDMTNTVK